MCYDTATGLVVFKQKIIFYFGFGRDPPAVTNIIYEQYYIEDRLYTHFELYMERIHIVEAYYAYRP